MNAFEQDNVKLVSQMLKAWAAADATGTGLAAFFTDDCFLRLEEDKPATHGKAAAIALFDHWLGIGRFQNDVSETFAKGPVVTNSRVDHRIVNGKCVTSVPCVGFFVVRNGKIAEWSDFLVR